LVVIVGVLITREVNSPVVLVDPTHQPTSALLAHLSETAEPEPILPAETRLPPPPDPTQEIVTPAWQAQQPYIGIWLSQDDLAALPISGTAWINLKAAADLPLESPDLSDLNNSVNVYILAKALVYGRTGLAKYRQEAITGI
jgi:hypothetical protein